MVLAEMKTRMPDNITAAGPLGTEHDADPYAYKDSGQNGGIKIVFHRYAHGIQQSPPGGGGEGAVEAVPHETTADLEPAEKKQRQIKQNIPEGSGQKPCAVPRQQAQPQHSSGKESVMRGNSL